MSPSFPDKPVHGYLRYATTDFRFAPFLRPNHVWDAVVILWLLEDCQKQSTTLEVPDKDEQDQRFRLAMDTRNVRLQRYGLGQTLHRCNKCVRFFDERHTGGGISKYCVSDSQLEPLSNSWISLERTRVVVTDGMFYP